MSEVIVIQCEMCTPTKCCGGKSAVCSKTRCCNKEICLCVDFINVGDQ